MNEEQTKLFASRERESGAKLFMVLVYTSFFVVAVIVSFVVRVPPRDASFRIFITKSFDFY